MTNKETFANCHSAPPESFSCCHTEGVICQYCPTTTDNPLTFVANVAPVVTLSIEEVEDDYQPEDDEDVVTI